MHRLTLMPYLAGIILVIHDINFASAYSDDIIAMKNGAVFMRGEPADIMQPEVLARLFEIPVTIETVANQRIPVYYRSPD